MTSVTSFACFCRPIGPSIFSTRLYSHTDPAYAAYRTLIDSTPGVLKAWDTFAKDYSLGDSAAIAHATHGRRLHDTLREYCHIEDEAKLRVRVSVQATQSINYLRSMGRISRRKLTVSKIKLYKGVRWLCQELSR